MRDATRDLHHRLENTLLVAAPGAGQSEYLTYAAALLGWMAPFEAQLWSGPWPADMQPAERAGKARWIEDDLRAAGLDDAAMNVLPASGFAPRLDTLAARFGTAYVIEGAQLGTQVLRKKLSSSLASPSPRWLLGYGPQTAEKWHAFVACAEMHLADDASRSEAAAAARDAFASLAAWFELRGATSGMATMASETSDVS